MKQIVFTALIALAPLAAWANPDLETIRLGGGFSVADSQTQTLRLDGPRYVRNLVIQAQGNSTESTIEVMVNGQVKGTIFAPGRDPSYVVTIAETTRSVEFRHRAGGSMRIIDVTGTVSRWRGGEERGGGGFSGSKDQVADLALQAIRQIEVLKQYSSFSEEENYLFPIKRNAGLVYVMATAHGEVSRKTARQLLALIDQIDFAHPFLSDLMQRDGAFQAVVDLLTIRESISDMLD